MRNSGKRLFSLLLAAVLAFALAMPVLAAVPERPENQYVLDSAGVLSEETEREIVAENQKLFRETGAQIVVAAVDFLGGDEIDDYVYDMFNIWGVGSKERNNGILLVLAIGEDNYYAQSGYGIEDYFDGSKLDELLYEYLEPDFAVGDYDAGVKKFFDATLSEMESFYRDYEDEYTQADSFNQGGTTYDYSDWDDGYQEESIFDSLFPKLLSLIFRVVIILVIVIVVIAVIRAFSGGGGGGGSSGGGGGGFWRGMFLGNMLGNSRRNRWYGAPPPPPPPGGFGPRPPRPPRGGGFGGGFGGFGGFGGGHSGGFSGGGRSHGGGMGRSGGFSGGGGSRGGGAGRR